MKQLIPILSLGQTNFESAHKFGDQYLLLHDRQVLSRAIERAHAERNVSSPVFDHVGAVEPTFRQPFLSTDKVAFVPLDRESWDTDHRFRGNEGTIYNETLRRGFPGLGSRDWWVQSERLMDDAVEK